MYKGVIVDILKKPIYLKKPREKPGFFKKPGFYWVFSKKWVFFPTLRQRQYMVSDTLDLLKHFLGEFDWEQGSGPEGDEIL